MDKKQVDDIIYLKDKLDEMNIEEIINSEVKSFGTSAHIIIPKKHINKNTIILILKK
jgi:putative transposon-encoded protein